MTAKLIGYGIAVIAVVLAIFGCGYYVAHLEGAKNLASLQSDWDKERASLSSKRADAIASQQKAERGQADAINQAAANYEKGKDDAEASSAATVADLRSGALRLRDQWATCRTTVAAGLPSASGGQQPDGGTDDREASAGRIVRAAADADAQIRGLQQALMGERVGQ